VVLLLLKLSVLVLELFRVVTGLAEGRSEVAEVLVVVGDGARWGATECVW